MSAHDVDPYTIGSHDLGIVWGLVPSAAESLPCLPCLLLQDFEAF